MECQLAFGFLVRRSAKLGGVINAVRPGVPQRLLFRDAWRLGRTKDLCESGKPHGLCKWPVVDYVVHARIHGKRGTRRGCGILNMDPIPGTFPLADDRHLAPANLVADVPLRAKPGS